MRASNKDYIDLYFIPQNKDLNELLEKCARELPSLYPMLALKSLAYFEEDSSEKFIQDFVAAWRE